MEKNQRPFGMRDKLGYMAGDIANNFTFTLVASFLMLFYTDVWGIDPKKVASLFVIARLFDAFTDVGMGTIVDKFPGNKDGKFRPFIKWGAIPVALAGFLLFQTGLKDMSMGFKVAYMYITYILWGSLTYTFINIPYGSMASAITPNPDERTALSTFRTLGQTVAQLVIGFVTPLLLYKKVAGQPDMLMHERFLVVAGAYAVLAVVFYMLCYSSVTERVPIGIIEKDAEEENVFKGIGKILKRRAILTIILMSILLLLAMLLIGSMNVYIYPIYFGNSTGASLAGLFAAIPMLLGAPLAMKLGQKFGKKEASSVGLLFGGGVLLLLYILKLDNMYAFLVGTSISYLGIGIFNTLTWAMITDVIDELEIQNGTRDDGKVYALYSFARKLGQAAAGGLAGYVLSMIGYVAGQATQTREVAVGIYNATTLYPAIALLATGLIAMFLYPLSRKRVDQNVETLARKRAAMEGITVEEARDRNTHGTSTTDTTEEITYESK